MYQSESVWTIEHHVEELDQARELAENDYNAYDQIAPGTQQQESETAQEEPTVSEEFVFFNPDKVGGPKEYDIGIELGTGCSAPSIEPTENILPNEDYLQLLRSLNMKQRQFYNHVIHWIKTNLNLYMHFWLEVQVLAKVLW